MNLHYRSQCTHGHTHDTVQLAKSEPIFDRLIEQYIRSLFDEREVSDELKERLWAKYYNKLTKGLDKGYSPKLKHYDAELGAALKKNIAVFSAFKETSFREELEANLTDNGKFLPWSDFKKKAASISGDYNKRWLETEYHHTVANANMAKKWKRFQRDKDLYANLKYDAVNDNQTRAKHRAWDGVILPIDHPWWETHLPPNDWGCRCDAIQTDEPVTAEIPEGKIKAAFSNNPAKSGEVFSEIAYADGVGVDEAKAIIKFGKNMFEKTKLYALNYADYRKYLKDPDYIDVDFDRSSGGMKATHLGHKFDKERGHYEKEVQGFFFKKGDKFILEVEKDTGKQIEGYLNEIAVEIKSITGKSSRTIRKRIAQSVEKGAEIAILYFPDFFSEKILNEALENYVGKLPKIIILHKDKIIRDDR